MAMDRNDDLGMTRPNSMADRDPTLDSTRDTVVYDRDTGGSNFLAHAGCIWALYCCAQAGCGSGI